MNNKENIAIFLLISTVISQAAGYVALAELLFLSFIACIAPVAASILLTVALLPLVI